MIWLLTCEHYSNGVPLKFAKLFTKAVDVLESHRGYDLRVAPLFIRIEPLFDESRFFRYSRLLIEPNAAIGDPHLFSPFTTQLGSKDKAFIISTYYMPYRKALEAFIDLYIKQGVLHVSLRTFHPKQGNRDMRAEIGIRFSSTDRKARKLAVLLKACIQRQSPQIQVRFNYPYRGDQNHLPNYLMRCYPEQYTSIELEVRNDKVLALRPTLYAAIASMRGILE